MGSQRDWYERIAKQIDQLKLKLSEKDYKKYKLSTLLCIAERIAEVSPECGQCQIFQQDISTLAQDTANIIQLADRRARKAYFKTIESISEHLRRHHNLVTEGYYIVIGIAIGSGLGVAIGTVLPNIATGIPIGVGVGIAIGAALDAKAKKEGRVICPSEKTSISIPQTKLVVIVGLGIIAAAGLVAYLMFRSS